MDLARQILFIAGVIALLILAVRALRSAQGTGHRARRLAVVERVSLSSDCHVMLIRWDGKEVLVSTGPQPCRLLATSGPGGIEVLGAERGQMTCGS